VRSRAIQARLPELKAYLKNRPDPRKIRRAPTSLEKKIGEFIISNYPEIRLRYNVWKALKDDKESFIHLESDVVLNLDKDVRIVILCDGMAFHGEYRYFNRTTSTVEEDERRSRILHQYNPYVVRYSEKEIKNDFAQNHIKILISKVKNEFLGSYYRNWMLNIEEPLLIPVA
jgi:hypothetical protein